MARWALYLINNNASMLPDTRLDLYSAVTDSVRSVVGATATLIQNRFVRAIIVDLPEDSTQLVADVATTYGVPVLSISSSTNAMDSKAEFSYLFARLDVPDDYQCIALLTMLSKLNISSVTYVYTNNVYGINGGVYCITQATAMNISVLPLSTNGNDSVTAAKALATSKVIFISTNQEEGIPLIRALQDQGLYGPEFFYILNLEMGLAIAQDTLYDYPLTDGSVILAYKVYEPSDPYYIQNKNAWSTSDPIMFPGERPAEFGYSTMDAANIYAYTLASFENEGVPSTSVKGPMLHNRVISTPQQATSGIFRFDANSDRPGSFYLFNVKNGDVNITIQPNDDSITGYFDCATGVLSSFKSPTYYNGSAENPFFVQRFYEKCSFAICNYRGNCSAAAKCICDKDFTGKHCEKHKDKTGTLVAEIVAPVVFVLFAVVIIAMYLVHKRRRELFKEVKDKQRSDIARVDLKLLDRIGRGASGEVMKGLFRGTEVAVKRLLTQNASKAVIEEFSLEIAIMCGLRHPNIIMFMGSCYDPSGNEMLLVMELMTRGSLHDVLHSPKVNLPFDMQLHLALQAAQGMNFLHSSNPPIIHCDLKSHNILLDDKWTARISDFGITRFKDAAKGKKDQGGENASSFGTIFWTAPEVLDNKAHSEKSDCYAYGVVLWELFHRATPYEKMDVMQVAVEVGKGKRPDISPACPEEIQRLIRVCWHQEPAKRPSFQQVVDSLRQLTILHPLQDLGNHSLGRVAAPTGQVYLVSTIMTNAFVMMDLAPRATTKAISTHNQHIRTTMESYGGYEVSSSGPQFLLSFSDLKSAIDWCTSTQISLMNCTWPAEILKLSQANQQKSSTGEITWSGPRVRMVVHSGAAMTEKDSLGHLIYKGPVPERVNKMLLEAPEPGIFVSPVVHDELIDKLSQFSEQIVTPCEAVQGASSTSYYVLPQKLAKRRAPGMETPVLNLNAPSMDNVSDALIEGSPSWYISWKDINVMEGLGRGNIGDFQRAAYKGREVAVKILVNQKIQEEDLIRLTADVALLSKIDHPNLLPVVGTCIEEHHISIITAFAARGNLRALLSDSGTSITMAQSLKIARDIAAGMEFLSKHPDPEIRIHDNFKSHNVLLMKDWEVKITDYGQSNVKDLARTMTSVSNVAWTAPEILEGEDITPESALYSFGMILWEILTRKIPYEGEHPIKVVTKILAGYRPTIPKEKIPAQCTEILQGCWNRNVVERPSWHVIQTELSFALEQLQ